MTDGRTDERSYGCNLGAAILFDRYRIRLQDYIRSDSRLHS